MAGGLVVSVDVRATRALRGLRNYDKRRLYAISNAVNKTALAIQRAQQEGVQRRFVVRKHSFIMRQAAIIKPFARPSPATLWARVAVGQKPRLLLSDFESGGERKPFVGKNVAVPVIGGARSSKAASIPRGLWIERLALGRHAGQGGITGQRGTYLIPNVGIFQRRGPTNVLLYAFTPSVTLPRSLLFYWTARATAERVFHTHLESEIAGAIAYANARAAL